jgi:hypothetical protein
LQKKFPPLRIVEHFVGPHFAQFEWAYVKEGAPELPKPAQSSEGMLTEF